MRSIFTGLQDGSDGFFGAAAAEAYTNFFPSALYGNNPGFGASFGTPVEIPSTPALTSEAAQALAAQSGATSTVSMTSGGITINLLFDAAAMAAPASFRAGIQQAASLLTASISDQITVNIKIDYSGTGGGAAAGPDNGLYESYSTVKTDLTSHATAGDTVFNALPSGSSIQGQANVAVWNAQLKLWGILGANDTTTDDGSATFATDINPSLLVGVALHELTHAMGRVPYGSAPDIFDLFRFSSAGTRMFSGASTASPAYFSVDGGTTKLADYGQTSDPSDFLNSGVQGYNDPFNEFYSGGTVQSLTAVDKEQLDALGFHLTSANHAPVMSLPATNVSATAGQVLTAASLFSASDADNDTLTYFIFDATSAANSGHFSVNGTTVPAGGAYAVSATQLAQTTFVAGTAGTSDDLYVEAFDGHVYSGWSEFHVNVAAVNYPPVMSLTSANVATSAGQVLTAASLFSASDADNDTLTYYVFDATSAANSGHFSVNGTEVPANASYGVSAAQLGQTTFVAGAAGTSDDLYVEVFDGHVYSGWSEFHVNVAAANHPPVMSLPSANVAASAGQTLTASSLFSATDADNDPLTYFVFDNGAANGGHFSVNGATVPLQQVYQISAAQLAQTNFVAGAAGTSDDLFVEAYDGKAYSGWSEFHVNVPAANTAPVMSVPNLNVSASAGQTLAATSLFSATDANNDPLTYFVFDNGAANSGHFSVNGTTVPLQQVYQISAAQLTQTTFVAGAAGTSADLFAEAYDGHTYSGWTEFHILV